MSIQSEINRINNNVQESLDVCRDAGVSVASDANSNDLPGATRALASSFLPLTGGTVSGVLTVTGGANISGRAAGGGDDEGLVIGRASNSYAGLCLGAPTGVRSVFYLLPDNSAKWRYVGSSGTSSDIAHPGKAGTIALTDDLHSANKIELGTVGIMASDSNEISFKSNANVLFFGYDNRMGSAVPVDTYNFGTHTGTAGATKGKIVCGEVVENGASLATKYALKSEIPTDYLPKSGGTVTGELGISGKVTQGNPSGDSTVTNMNRFQADLFVEGNGSAPNQPKAAGFYLGKSATDGNRHMDIVSGETYSYIDFNKAGNNLDYDVRLLVDVATGYSQFMWDGSKSSKALNVIGSLQQNSIPVALQSDLGRTTAVNAADTNYTTLMARGTSLHSSATTPAVNGAICWQYK